MTRPLVMLAVALSTLLDGCAPTSPGSSATPLSPTGDTAYLALTRYKACQWDADRFNSPSHSAVVRYYTTPVDTVRYPFRVITGPSTALCMPAAVALGPGGELFVLNQAPKDRRKDSTSGHWQSWVTVYDSSASGDARPLRVLHVQPSSVGNPSLMRVDRQGNLYLGFRENDFIDQGSIAVFEVGAEGDAKPLRVITGPGTGLDRPVAIAVDRRGFVYALNSQDVAPSTIDLLRMKAGSTANFNRAAEDRRRALQPDAVRVFAPGAAGDAAPSRVIGGKQTELRDPVALGLDRSDRLYVANHGTAESGKVAITMYGSSATGDAAPTRRFSDGRTYYRMEAPTGLMLDSHDSLFVRSGGDFGSRRSLAVFAPADSNRPSRSFDRNAPALFAFDRYDTLYVLAGDTVKVFRPGYAGGASPVRAIAGPNTGIGSVTAMALDHDGLLYLASDDSSAIRVYAAGSSGDTGPIRRIAGPHTRLVRPKGLALDSDGRLYVTSGPVRGRGGAILVYMTGAQGEDAPVRTVAAPDVTLPPLTDMTIDSRGHLYVAANENTGAQVLVFGRRDDRSYSLLHTLAGPSTLLRNPIALAVGPGDTLYALNAYGEQTFTGLEPYLTSATVTVYSPGARGDTQPLRSLVVVEGAQNPGLKAPYLQMRYLAVDSTGAVHLSGGGNEVIYPPRARGRVTPFLVRLDPRVEGAAGATTIASDGTVWQAIGALGRNVGIVMPD